MTAAAALPPVIQARALGKSYGPAWAVQGVDLTLAAGGALAVFGGNGAGKSTLLRLLATLVAPSQGTLRVLGQDAVAHPQRVRPLLGVLGTQSYLYADLTVAENLDLYARLYRLPAVGAQVQAALAAVRLEAVATRRVRDCSRGMQQRLALARATLHQPRLLVLDEPEGGLDAEGRACLAQLVTHGRSSGQVVVLATHDLDLGLALCGRALILAAGCVTVDAPATAYTSAEWRARCASIRPGTAPA